MVCPDAANKCGRSCAKRENLSAFRVVLVFLVLVQVVAAVAIVFFLAFSAATSSGERIFTQLMDSVIERSRSDMDDFFKHPLRLVRLMHAGMRWMLPGVIQQVRTSVWDPAATPTVFSALSFLINQAPGDIASLGFGTKNGSAFIVHVGNASVDFVTSMVSDVDSLTYVRLPEGAYARQTWDNVTEDVFRNDTLSDLLSQDRARVVNVVPQFNTTQRTWFVRAMELGGKVGWSDPIPMVGQYTGNIAIPVVQALIPEGSTEPVGATFISVGLAQVHSRLRALPIGSRGVALFVTSSGELLSSSVPGIEALRSPTAIRLWANDSALSAYPVVQAMLHRLRGWDLVGSTASNAIFEGCVYTDAALVNDRPCPVLHADLDVDGDEYRILGAPLRIPGMNGTIAIAALKSEFDGGLSSQIKRSLTYAAIVLSVATLLTFLIAFCVTRPFRRMAWFFSELSAMLAKSSASLNKRGSVSPFNATDRIGPPKPRSSDHIGIVATESDELMGMNGRPQSQQSLVLHHDILVPIEERQPTCLSLCFPPADFSSAIDEVRMMQDSYQQLLDDLSKSRTELAEANDLKKQLIRYVFHELRVPLGAAVLSVEQLRSTRSFTEDATVSETVQILDEQHTTISRILDDVLSLQKIEDGAFELHLIPFTLRSLVDNVSRSFNPAATAKGLQLQVNVLHCAAPYLDGASANDADRHSNITSSQALATTLTSPAALVSTLKPAAAPAQGEPLLLGDFYRLQQVLANFVSNAIKFTSSGSIRIQAECVRNGGPVVSTVTVPSKVVGRASRGYAQTHSHVELNVMDSAASPAAVSPSDHGAMASVLVRISVIDSGVGLSEADQALLFCPYRQVSLGKLQKDKGSGLGLAICKRLVELHGGTVGCKSGLGLGSQFYFEVPLSVLPPGRAHSSVVNVQHDLTLPYALHRLPSTSPRRSSGQSALEVNRTELTEAKLDDKVPALTTDVPSLSASASNVSIVTPTVTASPPSALIAEAAACRKRILVVEDTDVNRRLLVGLLVRLGYDAVGVEHGQMCVDLFQEWRNEAKSGEAFDMVLMDGQMPVLDGAKASTALRTMGVMIPIIGVTGNALMEDREQFIQAGANAVLCKPVTKPQLQATLQEYLRVATG